MKFRKLGKTGLIVSEIGLGTAQLGGTSFIGGRYIGSPRIERKEALAILQCAFDSGINFFDTSDKYGDGEAERLLSEVFCHRRNKVILSTKCGITSTGERCFRGEYVKNCLEQSLKNLKTDYVDIFQLTKPDLQLIQSGSIYRILDDLKKEGKIRFSGISTGTDEETMKLINDNSIDTLQIFYNLLHISPNELFIKEAFESQIGLIVRSPLSSGMLSGRYNYNTRFSDEDDRSYFLFGKTLCSRIDSVSKIIEHFSLTDKYSIVHFSLNYLLSNPEISAIIPGVSKKEQLADMLKVKEMKRMTPAMLTEIEQFIKENTRDD